MIYWAIIEKRLKVGRERLSNMKVLSELIGQELVRLVLEELYELVCFEREVVLYTDAKLVFLFTHKLSSGSTQF